MSNKFKVGDEVFYILHGENSSKGVIVSLNKEFGGYDIKWPCVQSTFRYSEVLLDFYANHPNEVKKRKETQVKKLEDYSVDVTKKVTPKDIYTASRDLQEVRDLVEKTGLEITDFRPPINRDMYIAAAQGTTTKTAEKGSWRPKEPRFIVTRPRSISDTEIINFIERNRMGWGLTNDGYVFSYMGHFREEGKNFRESIIKHIRREERKES